MRTSGRASTAGSESSFGGGQGRIYGLAAARRLRGEGFGMRCLPSISFPSGKGQVMAPRYSKQGREGRDWLVGAGKVQGREDRHVCSFETGLRCPVMRASFRDRGDHDPRRTGTGVHRTRIPSRPRQAALRRRASFFQDGPIGATMRPRWARWKAVRSKCRAHRNYSVISKIPINFTTATPMAGRAGDGGARVDARHRRKKDFDHEIRSSIDDLRDVRLKCGAAFDERELHDALDAGRGRRRRPMHWAIRYLMATLAGRHAGRQTVP